MHVHIDERDRETRTASLGSQQYIYRWDRHGRKGQLCLVLARGAMNSCLCMFEDGYTMVSSRNALKLATDEATRTDAWPELPSDLIAAST
jgi:hypothetical protein